MYEMEGRKIKGVEKEVCKYSGLELKLRNRIRIVLYGME
jgi:hypothetical protein